MSETRESIIPYPPICIDEQTSMHIWHYIEIVDQDTGENIRFVQSADTKTGKIRRFDVEIEGNNGPSKLRLNEYGEPLIVLETRNVDIQWTSDGIREFENLSQTGPYHLTATEFRCLNYLFRYALHQGIDEGFVAVDLNLLGVKLLQLEKREFLKEYRVRWYNYMDHRDEIEYS